MMQKTYSINRLITKIESIVFYRFNKRVARIEKTAEDLEELRIHIEEMEKLQNEMVQNLTKTLQWSEEEEYTSKW
jgi:galactokinase